MYVTFCANLFVYVIMNISCSGSSLSEVSLSILSLHLQRCLSFICLSATSRSINKKGKFRLVG